MTDKFCLRWNDFEANISLAFQDLQKEEDFFDVTIACEDHEQIKAHKVILASCSLFFKNILRRNQHQHPLLYLKGVKSRDFEGILNFIYQGEVNVAQDHLNGFLAVAEELQIKGLTQQNTQCKHEEHVEGNNKTTSQKGVIAHYNSGQGYCDEKKFPRRSSVNIEDDIQVDGTIF